MYSTSSSDGCRPGAVLEGSSHLHRGYGLPSIVVRILQPTDALCHKVLEGCFRFYASSAVQVFIEQLKLDGQQRLHDHDVQISDHLRDASNGPHKLAVRRVSDLTTPVADAIRKVRSDCCSASRYAVLHDCR